MRRPWWSVGCGAEMSWRRPRDDTAGHQGGRRDGRGGADERRQGHEEAGFGVLSSSSCLHVSLCVSFFTVGCKLYGCC
uniref:Uncharacterized protein n=1 Tax=Arundo donax TaxID=35708 RepID=A0A0A8YVZ3_ARUDO